jgi:hypothetical protein
VELRFVLALDLSMLIRRSPEAKVDTDCNDEARDRSGVPKWGTSFGEELDGSNSDLSMNFSDTWRLFGLPE